MITHAQLLQPPTLALPVATPPVSHHHHHHQTNANMTSSSSVLYSQQLPPNQYHHHQQQSHHTRYHYHGPHLSNTSSPCTSPDVMPSTSSCGDRTITTPPTPPILAAAAAIASSPSRRKLPLSDGHRHGVHHHNQDQDRYGYCKDHASNNDYAYNNNNNNSDITTTTTNTTYPSSTSSPSPLTYINNKNNGSNMRHNIPTNTASYAPILPRDSSHSLILQQQQQHNNNNKPIHDNFSTTDTDSSSIATTATPAIPQSPIPLSSATTTTTTTTSPSPGPSPSAAMYMKRCETCSAIHDGSFGAGRFCSSRCARTVGGLAHRKKRLIERDAKQRFAYNTVDNNNSNNVLGNRISNHSVHQRVGGGIQKKTQHINYNNNNNKIAKGNNTSNSYFRRKGNLARLVMACTENLADNGVVAGRCNNNELNIVREEQRHHEERRVDKVSSGISISALLN